MKDYIFHDIKKHGRHLKKDELTKKKNNYLKELPKKEIPIFGPRIYYDIRKNEKIVKYIYKVFINKNKNFYRLIIETFKLPEDYKSKYKIYDKRIRECYYEKKY